MARNFGGNLKYVAILLMFFFGCAKYVLDTAEMRNAIQNLKEKIDKQKFTEEEENKQLERARQQVTNLQNELDDKAKEMERIQKQYEEYERLKEAVQNEYERMNTETGRLTRQNKELERQLNESQKLASLCKATQKSTDEPDSATESTTVTATAFAAAKRIIKTTTTTVPAKSTKATIVKKPEVVKPASGYAAYKKTTALRSAERTSRLPTNLRNNKAAEKKSFVTQITKKPREA